MTKDSEPAPGEKVEWNTPQGTTTGEVKEKLTHPRKIKGHQVEAAPDNPEFLVQSDSTGAEAAHKAEALHKPSK